ncbi:MAG: permease [Ruminococcaceae bacterium]|nr:permease [Oscillospiraceae bacterium]
MELFGGLLSVKAIAFLMFSVFAVAGLGYLLGRITIKGVSLGTAGTFIVALVFGCFFYETLAAQLTVGSAGTSFVSEALKVVENLGLILFVTSVGFIAGPGFFANMKKNFKSYVVLGLAISVVGGLATLGCILVGRNFTDLTNQEFTAMVVGILSGSLTSTPAFAAAKDVVSGFENAKELQDIITVGHGIAYLFGVIGVVLFIQIIPKLLKVDMAKEVASIAPEKNENTEKKEEGKKKLIHIDEFGFGVFGIAVVFGLILGNIKIGSFSLTTTGGVLLTSLLLGHFGRIGKISLMPSVSTLKVLRELGLMLFLIGAGISGGAKFVELFDALYFLYGVIITVIPMVFGFLFSKYVLKLKVLNNLGSLTGGMTSTPALGTLITVSGTENVAAAYAATYPIALVSIVIVTQLLLTFF